MSAPRLPGPSLLPVGHRLGPVHDVDGSRPVALRVRVGGRVEELDDAAGSVWLAAHVPGDRPGSAPGRGPDVVASLQARGLLVEVTPGADTNVGVARGLRARPLGIGLGESGPELLHESFGLPGAPQLTLPAETARLWDICLLATDLWAASVGSLVLRASSDDHQPTRAEAVAELHRVLAVLPEVLAAGCGYLDVAEHPAG